MTKTPPPADELMTIRDWLRYAVSRFNAADLVYGHGTETALDEAAFIILASLSLDVGEIDPWLDARLVSAERNRLAGLIEARISTRKPAAYLVGAAYVRGHRFRSDERAIIPRSFIAELLCDRMEEGEDHFPPLPLTAPVSHILDLCTGGGSLAILAALAFPDATVDAVDISPDALSLAAENIAEWGLGERVHLFEGNLFEPLGDRRYDLVISNPPYVTDAAVAAFPPEYRAEPVLAHRGGSDGLDLVRNIIVGAAPHLAPSGQIVIEIGQAADALVASFPDVAFTWVATATSSHEVVAIGASGLASPSPGPRTRRRSR